MASGYIATLSFGQRQIRMAELLRPGRTQFAMPLMIGVAGALDVAALRIALAAVLRRHDSLRATFPLVDGAPVQAVADASTLVLDVRETRTDWDSAAFATESRAWAQAMMNEPFDLAAGPLTRFSLLRAGDAGAMLIVIFHHIVCDGASLPVFLRDLVAAYDDALCGRAPSAEDLPLQFPDFADWEQERFAAAPAERAAAAAEWRDRLGGAPARLELPYDRRPKARTAGASGQAQLCLDAAAPRRLAAWARARGASEFSLFLTVFVGILRRWSGLDDLVVTVPASRRDRPELADLIGLLVDTLPIRATVADGAHFPQLLAQVRDALRAALAHRDLPFEKIVEASGVERRGEGAPFMQILFGAAETPHPPRAALDGATFEILSEELDQEAKADLSLVYAMAEDGLRLWCRYDAGLFAHESMVALLGWFGRMVEALSQTPDLAILEAPLQSEAEGLAQLRRFNATASPYERDASAIGLFFREAAAHPALPAIEENGAVQNYGALALRVRRIATALARKGVCAGEVVMLALPVSGALIEAQLAVLALGAAHAPLDPAAPAEQREARARLVGARRLIADDGGAPIDGCALLRWSELLDAAETAEPHPNIVIDAQSPAYVMFTSGSTGEPKAVSVPHRAIVRLARARGLAEPAFLRAAVYSNPAFDASTLEIWLPLLNGGALAPVDRSVVMDPRLLRLFLAEARISLLWVTAGLFQQIASLDPGAFAGPRKVITGGDVVPPAAARAVLAAGREQGLVLINGYGPTENTTFSTIFDIAGLTDDDPAIPIGAPISNSTAYILDPAGRPLPPGLVGEIWVGGDGVALGYAGDPELTAARFRDDPFAETPGGRMYRTGDLGRWRPDGAIVFLGRADRQVKIRGFRVELGEIEAALARHPAVGGAVATAPRRDSGERDLVAYVAPKPGMAPSAAELRDHLSASLSRQMRPHAIVIVDRLPLNANGKVDLRALPAAEITPWGADEPLEPRTPEERTLARIWGDLLGAPHIGVKDNFFHVGGDSILTIRLVARAYEAGLDIELKDVFAQPTIEQLAAIAIQRQRATPAEPPGARHAVDLIAGAQNPRQPCRLISIAASAKISALDVGYALQRLAERHDGLRLALMEDAGGRHLVIAEAFPAVPVRCVTLPADALAELEPWIAAHRARLTRGVDLAAGVTLAASLVKREGASNAGLVILAVHEAVADDRALLLLASELEAALAADPQKPFLPAPPVSFAQWLSWLGEHVASPAVRAAAMARENRAPPASPFAGASADGGFEEAQFQLDALTSRRLLEELPARLRVSAIDALLVALGETLGVAATVEVIDARRNLPAGAPEAAGMIANLDVVLPLEACAPGRSLAIRLAETKTMRQSMEPLGLAMGAVRAAFRLPEAAIGLALQAGQSPDAAIRLHHPPAFSPSVKASLNARITGMGMTLVWSGPAPPQGGRALLETLVQNLRAISDWSETQSAPLLTSADFPLAELDADTLVQTIGEAHDIEDIYPLSPMQEAMLLHSLSREGSVVNVEQSCLRFSGALDILALRKAWALVFERHPVLRTVFRWRGLARPLQLVRRPGRQPVAFETWPVMDAARLEQRLAQDRAEGFDLERGPLARMVLIRVSAQEAYLIATFHHILMDGWCTAQLEREARAAYDAFRRAAPPALPPVASFRDFIAWSLSKTPAPAPKTLRTLLQHPPRQPAIHPAVTTGAAFVTLRRQLSLADSKALSNLSRRRGLTIATLAHLAWGLWSAARRGCRDTVFCATVSGRPPQAPGVEQIIGLFIKNLPVRLRFDATSPLLALAEEIQGQLATLQSCGQISLADLGQAAGLGARAAELFDTLLVVENMPSGSEAWAGSGGLRVEAVHNALKTAYSLTGVVIPGDRVGLALVLPDHDGAAAETGAQMIDEFARLLAALPGVMDQCVSSLPLPAAAPVAAREPRVCAPDGVVPSPPPSDPLEEAALDILSTLLGRRLGPTDNVLAAGITSLGLTTAASRLSERLGRKVPVTALIEHRTVAALARALEKPAVWDAVVPLAPGRGEPFVCVHPIAGDVSAFLELAGEFSPETPFWALQAPGLEPGQTPPASVEALASANLEALRRRGLPKPRWLGGYSFGGVVAYEMACQLASRGAPPERLVIIDTPAPLGSRSILPEDPRLAEAEWLVRMARVRARRHGVEMPLSPEELLPLDAAARFALARTRMAQAGVIAPETDEGWLRRAYVASRALYQAFLAYRPSSNAARNLPLCLVRASSSRLDDLGAADAKIVATPDMGWSRLVDGRPAARTVDGDHISMLSGAAARATAAAIVDFISDPCPACG